MMFRIYNTNARSGIVLVFVLICFAGLNAGAYYLPVNLIDFFGGAGLSRTNLINYAPEVWLSLLVMVFGSLIIVISIASSNTPKLIDLYIGEYHGLFYLWFIVLASFENSFLQVRNGGTMFLDNLIFLINYFLLPVFTFLAIPYTFYILKYTKDSNVITKIYQDNRYLISSAARLCNSPGSINDNHRHLFETINQLDDLLENAKFKEPMGNIINKLGLSLRFYLTQKSGFQESYFILDAPVKEDVSFKTLSERLNDIEQNKIFYEQKVFRLISTTYNRLILLGFFDLASLCGSEMYESVKAAVELGDRKVSDLAIIQFNTMMRYGINQARRTKEVRGLYDLIFYYSQMIDLFIQRREEGRIIRTCQYLTYYGKEVNELSLLEPSFVFLIDVFAVELKKALMALHSSNSPRELQRRILDMFNELGLIEPKKFSNIASPKRRQLRIIQITLSLFYLENDEHEFHQRITGCILRELALIGEQELQAIIVQDCEQIERETEHFWEETDRGNRNIYFSPHKSQLPKFLSLVLEHPQTLRN